MQHQKLETSWTAHGDRLASIQESKFMVKSLTKKRHCLILRASVERAMRSLTSLKMKKNRIGLLFLSGSKWEKHCQVVADVSVTQ